MLIAAYKQTHLGLMNNETRLSEIYIMYVV